MTNHTRPAAWSDLGGVADCDPHSSAQHWTAVILRVFQGNDIVVAAKLHPIVKLNTTSRDLLSRGSAARLSLLSITPGDIFSSKGKGSPCRPFRRPTSVRAAQLACSARAEGAPRARAALQGRAPPLRAFAGPARYSRRLLGPT